MLTESLDSLPTYSKNILLKELNDAVAHVEETHT